MKYRIKIEYHTGDSFNDYDKTSYLDGDWQDITIAEENIKRISDHYQWYQACNGWNKPKAKPEPPDCVVISERWDSTGSVKLLTDKKVEYTVYPFWCGYFERLQAISIESKLTRVEF